MNHITLLRIMAVVQAWDETTFPVILWVYAAILEIEWWGMVARNTFLENYAIKNVKLEKESNQLSENE